MAIWVFKINLIEITKTLTIGIVIMLLGFLGLYFLWIKNKHFSVPTDNFKIQYNFNSSTSYLKKMQILIMDLKNHDFWIQHIGFDGYCYLLFLQKLIIILIIYAIIYGLSSLLLYFCENIMNIGFMEDKVFAQTASNIYSILMVFSLTILVLLMIKNFRRQVASIYFFFYFAPNRNKGINFLKTRSVLLKNVLDYDMKGKKLTKKINEIFYEKSIYGKMFASRFLPDYKEIYNLERNKKYYKFYNELVETNRVGKLSQSIMSSSIKDQDSFQRKIMGIEQEMRKKVLNHKIINSNYAFACFNSFAAIYNLQNALQPKKKFGIFKEKSEDKQVKLFEFIDEKDINWENCYVKQGVKLYNFFLTLLIFFILIFMTTPASILHNLQEIQFFQDIIDAPQKSNSYIFKTFLPPLLILGINKIILFLIFKKAEIKRNLRYSDYQIQILNYAFYYILFNMVIVPGLAVPAEGSSLANILLSLKIQIFQNFYAQKSGDFFVTLLIQQTSFGFFAGITGLSVLIYYYLSPSAFLIQKQLIPNEQIFLKEETLIFDFGYICSINLTIIAMIFIYSIQIPMIVFLGIFYFIIRFLTDAHLLLNLYKIEMESSGRFIHNVISKVLQCLLLYQFALFLKIFYEDQYLGILIFVIFAFTVVVFILNQTREILSTKFFFDDVYQYKEENLKEWYQIYSHPMTMKFFTLPKNDLQESSYFKRFGQII